MLGTRKQLLSLSLDRIELNRIGPWDAKRLRNFHHHQRRRPRSEARLLPNAGRRPSIVRPSARSFVRSIIIIIIAAFALLIENSLVSWKSDERSR